MEILSPSFAKPATNFMLPQYMMDSALAATSTFALIKEKLKQ